jgi:phage-related baseplate assembly protein
MASLNDPVFIDTDPNIIVGDLIAFYETATGLKLSPAQAERLLINAWAYRESLVRSGVNEAAKQNLVAFAVGVILDYLGQLVGVSRLPSQPAQTSVKFYLLTGHGDVVIPRGTRVSSTDGVAVFYTLNDQPVASGTDDVTVLCQCETPGILGNGYIGAAISVILDPQPYLILAENLTTTNGGADVETDEQLRIRIYLAPEQYSTAGSIGGYKFFARSANQSIIDVEVFSSAPGVVDVIPMVLDDGGTPSEILAAVETAVSGEKVRPINDEVLVYSPDEELYAIEAELTLFESAEQASTLALAQASAQAYSDAHRRKLGLDIIRDQLKAILIIPNAVYSLNLIQPAADIILDLTKYAKCSSITITVVGLNNG